MEHDEHDVSRWVDDRLASLEPSRDWQPDSAAAMANIRRRGRNAATPRHGRWWLWATLSATAAAVFVAILLLSAPPACANPLGCRQVSAPPPPAPAPAPDLRIPATVPAAAPAPSEHQAPPPARNFKQSGSLTAPITCEVYTDYECSHCAAFYLETLPQLDAAYVQTGKVRLIHRDFPLPQHPYALLAARYANAAGELGYYQTAANRLFRTQQVWSGDGDVAGQLAQVLPPDVMQKVRESAEKESVADDQLMARNDHLTQTPTMVIVFNGSRTVIGGYLSFADLKARIDSLLPPNR